MDARQTTATSTLSLVIPANTVTLSYTSSVAGTAPESKAVEAGYELTAEDLPTLTDESGTYTFSKWKIGDDDAEVGTVIASDTELTAVWE